MGECSASICKHGTCHWVRVRSWCHCEEGFTGSDCKIDECLSSPCLNGGTCVDEKAKFSCICPREFWGTRCEKQVLTLGHLASEGDSSNTTAVIGVIIILMLVAIGGLLYFLHSENLKDRKRRQGSERGSRESEKSKTEKHGSTKEEDHGSDRKRRSLSRLRDFLSSMASFDAKRFKSPSGGSSRKSPAAKSPRTVQKQGQEPTNVGTKEEKVSAESSSSLKGQSPKLEDKRSHREKPSPKADTQSPSRSRPLKNARFYLRRNRNREADKSTHKGLPSPLSRRLEAIRKRQVERAKQLSKGSSSSSSGKKRFLLSPLSKKNKKSDSSSKQAKN
ncbi:EGF-like domain protein [Trichuris suis]|nr:EGF-like domain protein [Trichuris suis]